MELFKSKLDPCKTIIEIGYNRNPISLLDFEPDPNPWCSAPPIIIPDCDVSNLSQPPVDRADDDSASSTTLVPGIDLEYEQQLSPVACEILNFIDSVPDYTLKMEAAAVVRNHRLNLCGRKSSRTLTQRKLPLVN